MSIIITNPFRCLKYYRLVRIPHFKKKSLTDVFEKRSKFLTCKMKKIILKKSILITSKQTKME